jgi:cytochrome P450
MFWKSARVLGWKWDRSKKRNMISLLLQAVESGQAHLSQLEVANLMHILFGAGFETTAKFLGNALLLLLSDRTYWQSIQEHPESIPSIVEELLRFASSSLTTFRQANEDVELGGQIIPKGAMIHVLLASADHDEALFPEAETFDPLRGKANRHIAFGYGTHFCLGAPLARLETRIALEQLSLRLPSLRLVPGQEISYMPSIVFHGFKQLLVEWDA